MWGIPPAGFGPSLPREGGPESPAVVAAQELRHEVPNFASCPKGGVCVLVQRPGSGPARCRKCGKTP